MTTPRPTRRSWAEPWKIKMIEPIRMLTREQREIALKEAGFNTFLLRSEDVYIDLLTDSGTNAMSDNQWAGMMLGDEAYAGSRNFYNLEEAIRKYYGYRYVVPTHQGRGAEHILSQLLVNQGDSVPGNMYFTTTRLHQELAGGTFVDVIIPEGHIPASEHPFKGNMNLEALEDLIKKVGRERIPYICLTAPVNMAGGQPVSMENARGVRQIADKYELRVVLDATRAVENAYFIQQREEGYASKSIAEILKEFCSLTDACTMSAKKDAMVNIGGWLAMNDRDFFDEARNMVVIYEGLHTYGGLAGRDMEAMARGIAEAVEDDSVRARVKQVEYLGQKLIDWGIPVVHPIGGHAVFLDAKAVLSADRAGPVPRPNLGGRTVRRFGRPQHGTGDRLGRPQQGHRRTLLPETGTGADHHPPPGIHPGPHGRDRRIGRRTVRSSRQGPRTENDLRAEVSAVLPGTFRAAVMCPRVRETHHCQSFSRMPHII